MNIRQLQQLMQTQSTQSLFPTQRNENRHAFKHLFLQNLNQPNHFASNSSMSIRDILHGRPPTLEQTSTIKTPIEANLSQDLNTIIQEAAGKYHLDEKLIRSVIQHESNYNKDAVSHAGAEGYMQLMPGTARGLGVTDSFDARQNIFGGSNYLRQMLNRYDGNTSLALAAYNAGPGDVDKYGGIPPFTETQNYVKRVMGQYQG